MTKILTKSHQTMLNSKRIAIACTSIIVICSVSLNAYGQNQNKKLMAYATKGGTNKMNTLIYNITIKNKTDSIACILHSLFLNPTSEEPQGLAIFSATKTTEQYRLSYTNKDTTYDYDASSVLYISECILPHQTLQFKIQVISKNNDDKAKDLKFEYFYLEDLCYKNFIKEMTNVGSWYYKYERLAQKVELPR